jgi:hypothetical protein
LRGAKIKASIHTLFAFSPHLVFLDLRAWSIFCFWKNQSRCLALIVSKRYASSLISSKFVLLLLCATFHDIV